MTPADAVPRITGYRTARIFAGEVGVTRKRWSRRPAQPAWLAAGLIGAPATDLGLALAAAEAAGTSRWRARRAIERAHGTR